MLNMQYEISIFRKLEREQEKVMPFTALDQLYSVQSPEGDRSQVFSAIHLYPLKNRSDEHSDVNSNRVIWNYYSMVNKYGWSMESFVKCFHIPG